ncbi:MAG TPA: RNA methyltransferase [Luteitalea sp.]|nr:RNA methyltransferase [Luteitalea sp.]
MDGWAAVGDAGALRASGVFVAEGRRVIQRVLDGASGGAASVVAALATPAAAAALGLEALGDRLEVRSPAELQSLTGYNFHRGALALVRRPPPASPAAIVDAVLSNDSTGDVPPRTAPAVFVVGERIADADNVGSLFRNAQAFGARAVLLDDRSADPLYRKAVRTSLGAVLMTPWAQATMPDLLAALKAAGVASIGLTPDPQAPTLVDVVAAAPRGQPVALLVGNEGDGLSSEARAACDRLARIPMAPAADSLNVATAFAVAAYEFSRDPRS